MAKQIFINLAVNNLQQSFDFYTAIGFENNPQFSDDTGKCMVWADNIFVMLLTPEKFTSFTKKPIADSKNTIAGIYSLSLDTLQDVNTVMQKGLQAGGTEPNEVRDYGFMIQRTLEDPDGYTWEVFYMDMSKFPTENPGV
jgi:uncharacterized protein